MSYWTRWFGMLSWYSYSLRVRIQVRASFSTPVKTGPRAYQTSYTTGTVSFPGVKLPGRGFNVASSNDQFKEWEELCLYSPLGLHGLFISELHFKCTLQTSYCHAEFVADKPLSSTGFYRWADPRQPDNDRGSATNPGEDCGSMHTNGGLNDWLCGGPLPFICEQELW